jgi:hypothetical protein
LRILTSTPLVSSGSETNNFIDILAGKVKRKIFKHTGKLERK